MHATGIICHLQSLKYFPSSPLRKFANLCSRTYLLPGAAGEKESLEKKKDNLKKKDHKELHLPN